MLLNCPSCKSQYLVNSADLFSNGREVKCIKCNFQWFQSAQIFPGFEKEAPDLVKDQERNKLDYSKKLPSTFVEEERNPSLINSILMMIVLIFIITFYFFYSYYDNGILNLINYYFNEILKILNKFKLDLLEIFNNFSKILYDILN